MKSFIFLLVPFILISGCSSTKLVHQYKSPEAQNYRAKKIFIIGITSDSELRNLYETKMEQQLVKKGINAKKSIDFFETAFTENTKKKEELSAIENQLQEEGFDAILITKIVRQEKQMSVVDAYNRFAQKGRTFIDYYSSNQFNYVVKLPERLQLFSTETSLYCLCPEKDRELLWRGEINVENASKIKSNVRSYTRLVINNLKNHNLLYGKE